MLLHHLDTKGVKEHYETLLQQTVRRSKRLY